VRPPAAIAVVPMDSAFSQGWSAIGHILKPKDVNNDQGLVLSADFGDNEVFAIEEESCTICLVEYRHGDLVQRNAFNEESKVCDHIFHPECITEWIELSRNSECPCCRSPFAVLPLT
jgi:hypothetical protein